MKDLKSFKIFPFMVEPQIMNCSGSNRT